MKKTPNIGLNLTTDEKTSFKDWREAMDGSEHTSGKSNMEIIDEEFQKDKIHIRSLQSDMGNVIRETTALHAEIGQAFEESKKYTVSTKGRFNYVRNIFFVGFGVEIFHTFARVVSVLC